MKNMNWKSMLFLIAAIPVVNFVAGHLGRSAAEQVNAREAAARQPSPSKHVRIVVSSQDAEGVSQDQLDLTFLKNLEAYTVERVKVKTGEYLASIGQPNVSIDITSEATYVEAGTVKLAVIRLESSGSRQVFIAGIVGEELRKVGCIGESNDNIPITYGPCGEKIKDVFGVKIGG